MKHSELSLELEVDVMAKIKYNKLGKPYGTPLLVGPVGIGKTQSVIELALKRNMIVVVITAVHLEGEDIKGLPIYIEKLNTVKFIKFEYLKVLFGDLDPNREYMIIFDDLGQAKQEVIDALAPLFKDRRLADREIPDNVYIVATSNRMIDKSGVNPTPHMAKDRFKIYYLDVDFEDSINYYIKNDILPEIVGFLYTDSKMLHNDTPTYELTKGSNPRNIEALSNSLKERMSIKDCKNVIELYQKYYKENDRLFKEVIKADVGEEFAIKFITYIKYFMDIPNIASMIDNPELFEEVEKVAKEDENRKKGIVYNIAVQILSFLDRNKDNNTLDCKKMENILVLINKISNIYKDIAALILNKVFEDNVKMFQNLAKMSKHKELMEVVKGIVKTAEGRNE